MSLGAMRGVFWIIVAAIGTVLASAPAVAHPHVWVTIRSQILFSSDGAVVGVRHAWTFDDMFSAFATQGLPQQTKGQFTREELASLAEVNVTSLKEYAYFTFARADGKNALFSDPKDYWLDYRDAMLTLNFTLPLKQPVKAREFALEVYDETYFVAFEMAPKDPVALGTGAPPACRSTVRAPQELTVEQSRRLSELDAATPNIDDKLDDSFANRIIVICP
ncbi:MAG TPA: DUF1007 family protein [Pseudolabrys sp.]|nr:DUF1007 family protein [Pseudolabrys sp.]